MSKPSKRYDQIGHGGNEKCSCRSRGAGGPSESSSAAKPQAAAKSKRTVSSEAQTASRRKTA